MPIVAYYIADISIHALTRSATYSKTMNFQGVGFQSTHSRGVRLPITQMLSPHQKYFNPRTHEECD